MNKNGFVKIIPKQRVTCKLIGIWFMMLKTKGDQLNMSLARLGNQLSQNTT